MSSKIVVIGSCNVDLQCFTAHLPKPGETLHGRKFMKGCGGKGANQCVAAAKLGASSAMIARVGDDSYGQDFIKAFKDCYINTDFISVSMNESTGMAQITVADNGIAIVNAAPALPDPDPQIFKLSDIFCVNETEAELLTNTSIKSVDEAKVAILKLIEKGCNQVIITLGALGALYVSKDNLAPLHVQTRTYHLEPIMKYRKINTTDQLVYILFTELLIKLE
ncbi:Ribokinase [Blattella germanica]|nr:Ribokinase [Blattella germanica]